MVYLERGIYRLKNDYNEVLKILQPGKSYLLQEFVPEIYKGEKSLFFFNKEFRYAILKKPFPNEFKSNYAFCESIKRYSPTNEELDIAHNALDVMKCPSLIDRVDMVKNMIIEITVECPGHFVENAGVQKEIGKWFYEVIDKM